MRGALLASLAVFVCVNGAQAGEWHTQRVDAPARVTALETVEGDVRVNAGGLWYRLEMAGGRTRLAFIDAPVWPKLPTGALVDSRVAVGKRDIERVWLTEPTGRYDHGVLGDKLEAGALVIETRDGKTQTVRLKVDAVFEDLEPRLADLDGDGRDEVIVVKSYLKRGASVAVVAQLKGRYEVVSETPALGSANRWLNPAGIADFDGDGKIDIALVRQPHVVGELELWSGYPLALRRTGSLAGTSNHIIGSRALAMSATADFDGDGIMDIALPSLDRDSLRIVSFAPGAREIASIPLPAKAVTNIALMPGASGPPAIAAGLADGSLVVIRRD